MRPSARQAMCDECGALRTVSVRLSLRTGRRLRCENCARSTFHQSIEADPEDWRERRNLELTIEWEQYLRQEAFMVDLFQQLGIQVRTVAQITRDGKAAIYEVTRYVRDSEVVWEVVVLEDLTTVGRVYALSGAWQSMTALNVARWSDPDAYALGGHGWQWSGSFQPIGNKTHHESKPLFLETEDMGERGAERQR